MNPLKASPSDLAEIRSLLDTSKLPSSDVSEPMLAHFLLLRAGNNPSARLVGCVGLELYLERTGNVALIRSLAVSPQDQGHGYGVALLRAIESYAESLGIRALCLLTTTAAEFFAAHGYRRIDRSAAPTAIQTNAQFTTICPASATVMIKP